MALPTYVVERNVAFDSNYVNPHPDATPGLTPVILMGTVGTDELLLLWSLLDVKDKERIEEWVNAYGGTIPVAPVDGYQIVDFGGSIALTTDPTGLANDNTTYGGKIYVDNVPYEFVVIGSAVQTFGDLINEINTALGGAAVASLSAGNIVITTATTGFGSRVLDGRVFIQWADFFGQANGYVGLLDPLPGADDTLTAAKAWIADNGESIYDTYRYSMQLVGAKPKWRTSDISAVYWDGTVWKRFVDDTAI